MKTISELQERWTRAEVINYELDQWFNKIGAREFNTIYALIVELIKNNEYTENYYSQVARELGYNTFAELSAAHSDYDGLLAHISEIKK